MCSLKSCICPDDYLSQEQELPVDGLTVCDGRSHWGNGKPGHIFLLEFEPGPVAVRRDLASVAGDVPATWPVVLTIFTTRRNSASPTAARKRADLPDLSYVPINCIWLD